MSFKSHLRHYDLKLSSLGEVVAGVDEVGKGCLAGPVYAGALILDLVRFKRLPLKRRRLIRDSKTLSPAQRRDIAGDLMAVAFSFATGAATVAEIERFGIQPATCLAMTRAIGGLILSPDMVLVDGKLPIKGYSGRQISIVKGDSLCPSIAGAAILAKVARDEFMAAQAEHFPGYGFERHVGYGTAAHLEGLNLLGVSSLHRKNFAPVAKLLEVVC